MLDFGLWILEPLPVWTARKSSSYTSPNHRRCSRVEPPGHRDVTPARRSAGKSGCSDAIPPHNADRVVPAPGNPTASRTPRRNARPAAPSRRTRRRRERRRARPPPAAVQPPPAVSGANPLPREPAGKVTAGQTLRAGRQGAAGAEQVQPARRIVRRQRAQRPPAAAEPEPAWNVLPAPRSRRRPAITPRRYTPIRQSAIPTPPPSGKTSAPTKEIPSAAPVWHTAREWLSGRKASRRRA